MDISNLIGLLADEELAMNLAIGFAVAKGIASIIANNFDTEKWGKYGDVIDWLASNGKKAKMTGIEEVDRKVASLVLEKQPSNKLLKVLKALS